MIVDNDAELRRYYALRVVGSLANQMLQFLVPIMVFMLSGSVVWAGLALVVEWVPRLGSLIVAGPLVDRFGVRLVYVTSDVLRLTAAGSAVLLTSLSETSGLFGLIMLALVAGGCFEQSFVAGEKAVRILAPPATMHRAQSVLGGIDQATLLVAPIVGGAMLMLGTTLTILFPTVLFAASVALALRLPKFGRQSSDAELIASTISEPAPGSIGIRGLAGRFLISARWVFGNAILRDVVLMTMLINLMVGMIMVVAPILLLREYGLEGSYLGVIYTVAALASLLSVTMVPFLVGRIGLLRLGGGSAIASCAVFALAGVAPHFVVFAAMVIAFMAVESVFTVFIRTVRAQVVPANDFGSVVGVILLLNFLPIPLAGLVVVASRWTGSLSAAVLVIGIGALLSQLALLRHLTLLMARRPGSHRRAS